MAQHRYTVDEIDQMRAAIASTNFWHSSSRPDRAVENEALLRTYMQNGTTVAELQAWAAARSAAVMDQMRAVIEAQVSFPRCACGMPRGHIGPHSSGKAHA